MIDTERIRESCRAKGGLCPCPEGNCGYLDLAQKREKVLEDDLFALANQIAEAKRYRLWLEHTPLVPRGDWVMPKKDGYKCIAFNTGEMWLTALEDSNGNSIEIEGPEGWPFGKDDVAYPEDWAALGIEVV